MDIITAKKCLPFLLDANIAPNLVGEPGIGKTSVVNQFAEENGYKIFRLNLGNQDVGDLIGLADFTTNNNGEKTATKFMMPSWALELKEFAENNPDKYAIVYLDEINRASRRDVLQAIFPLILEKRLHTTQMPDNVRIIAAMNPGGDDDFVTELGEALLSRFCHIKVTSSLNSFVDYAKKVKIDSEIIGFLQDQPEMLTKKSEFSIPERKPDGRAWEMVNALKNTKIEANLFQELCYGIIGQITTIAFIKYCNHADKPFSANDILERFTQDKQDKIKTYSDEAGSRRMDMLKHTVDALITTAKENQIKKKQLKNLVDFILLIPKDLGYDLLRNLVVSGCDIVGDLSEDERVKELAKHSKELRKVK